MKDLLGIIMSPAVQQEGVSPTTKEEHSSSGTQFNHHHYTSSVHNANLSKERNVIFRNIAEVSNMNADRRSIIVIGIALLDERGIGKNQANVDNRNIVLGVVCIENLKINVEELRRLMCSELPSIPASFSFLTKEGWPVYKQQERLIKASHLVNEKGVICIQKQFEKQRIGIVESGGEPIGFVFADLNCNVRQLRDIIEQQLKLSFLMKSDYRFIERNGWPVMLSQETVLSVMDIILGCNVCVKSCDKLCIPIEHTRPTSVIGGGLPVSEQANEPRPLVSANQDVQDGDQPKRKKSSKPRLENQLSIKVNDKRGFKLGKDDLGKPLLISYVRAEAAQYALDLKKELVQMGFSVYLDVHEIKTGSDWQDALNFAVTHCFLFLPLITPMYGKTQWTNREIKLADVLGKLIVPVNFMENWPPACLAIQFASTQYIPWKLQESDHVQYEREKTSDPRMWDQIYVKRVSKQIAECYKENYLRWPANNIMQKSVPPLGSAKPKDDYPSIPAPELVTEECKQLIVISAHPQQRHTAMDLKVLLEKDGHQVWCSIDLQDVQDNVFSEDGNQTNPNTPRDLPPIPEGEVFFSQNDMEVSYSLGENKRSLSIYKEPEKYGKRPLSRLLSQFSDISYVSSLTQEKVDRLRTFQEKVNKAGVVIVLISEAYTKSTFSHQQVFYCEHRKRVVLVKCDSAPIPKWFRLLMGNDIITRANNPQFECVLKARVKRALDPTTSETPKDATAEAKMNYLVNFLKRNLPLQDKCVYIAGSSKLQTQRAEEICRAIGQELAKMKNVSVVTGGFYGAADITAKTFCECKENNGQSMQEDSSVVHILPMHDSEDLSSKSRQTPDGSFEAVPYGKTVFLGDSVKERETVVARLLDTCIVIEGGPGVVHEVEEFIWNDHFVIPIISTGGAAGGQYGVPVKIFELPPGVDLVDWSVLSDKEATPEEVAKAVVNIMSSLKKALASPTNTLVKPALIKRKSRKKSKSKKLVLQDQPATMTEMDDSTISTPPSVTPETMRSHFAKLEGPKYSRRKKHSPQIVKEVKWWRRLFRAFGISK